MILILGKYGQVGSALAGILKEQALAVDSSEINLLQPDCIDRLTALHARETFSTLINAAAYTQVDKAESEREIAMTINGHAVGALSQWCRQHDVTLVHYSTDYVFGDNGEHAHTEDEPTAPLNCYGESKLLGERLITASGVDHLIFRTSWVFDATGKNFVNTMRRLFKEREEMNVVGDQWGAPTYAPHLAQATIDALSHANNAPQFPSGIYHLCGSGDTNWCEFARAILALASTHESGIKCQRIHPISTRDYPTPAKRPLNSRLSCARAKALLSVGLPHWKDALVQCYESIRLRD